LTESDIKAILDRKSAAPLPTNLATIRAQERSYYSYTANGYARGRFSVVTVRDVEKEEDFEHLATLPQVNQVVPLGRLLLRGGPSDSERGLRQAAAALHADMLLVYTFDTDFFVGDALCPLSVVTLRLSPHERVRVATTASAALLDVRTGYVYGSCETTARRRQLAGGWTSSNAADAPRLKTEREAFENLLAEFERLWQGVVKDRQASVGAGKTPG